MNSQERTITADFQVEDPVAVFTAFSQEEIQRWRSAEPDFDEALHQEAVSLVLDRLKKRLGAAKKG